ncbi:unnamed protein product, partial [Onchocerca flexuosa]|uniref:Uncharacterized protein n=1 Tax=Onchocerca flexuosa TaxID=387005 RepID=A0A183I8C5_9BILA
MLIAEESAFQVIFDTLISQCRKYLKTPDKTQFDFSARSYPHALRRALYMLCDQRYLLSVVPSEQEWTPRLRENFLCGCTSLIRFLSFMQEFIHNCLMIQLINELETAANRSSDYASKIVVE